MLPIEWYINQDVLTKTATLVWLLASFLSADDFPQSEISNGQIHAKLYLPDSEHGYYRATRFDWSGVIASLEYKGHSYFGKWFDKYDPKIHDAIMGPVEEFLSGDSAVGYKDAKPGGTFLRIGVGVLRKPEEQQFQRFKTYEIVDHGKWTVHKHADSIEFVQTVTDPSTGYAYVYRKTVRMTKGKPEMVLEHSLKNTGRKPIETDVYDHNFFVIDGQTTGKDFTVKFPFDLSAAGGLNGLAELHGSTLEYVREVGKNDHVMADLKGFGDSAKDYDFRVENHKTGAGVHVTGDHPLLKVLFWCASTVLSPEPYLTMNIAPGSESRWRIAYEFYTL
jgi:hypothetical protein